MIHSQKTKHWARPGVTEATERSRCPPGARSRPFQSLRPQPRGDRLQRVGRTGRSTPKSRSKEAPGPRSPETQGGPRKAPGLEGNQGLGEGSGVDPFGPGPHGPVEGPELRPSARARPWRTSRRGGTGPNELKGHPSGDHAENSPAGKDSSGKTFGAAAGRGRWPDAGNMEGLRALGSGEDVPTAVEGRVGVTAGCQFPSREGRGATC